MFLKHAFVRKFTPFEKIKFINSIKNRKQANCIMALSQTLQQKLLQKIIAAANSTNEIAANTHCKP